MSAPKSNKLMDGAATFIVKPTHLGAPLSELQERVLRALDNRVHGLCFSAYLSGESPEHQSVLSQAQVRSRMEIIAPHCGWIRTFSCTDGNEHAPRIAHELGLKTLVGAWISDSIDKNEAELTALTEVVQAGHVDLIAVGNEVLYREELTEDELIALIRRTKRACPGVPVGYVDAYYLFVERPRLVEACDVLFINCYPFWEKFSIEASAGAMREMVARVQAVAKDKPIYITETGWPTQGAPEGDAVPSMENALIYALEAFEWAAREGIPLFYFAAFDEAWKTGPEGDCGAYWGLWDQKGRPKYGA